MRQVTKLLDAVIANSDNSNGKATNSGASRTALPKSHDWLSPNAGNRVSASATLVLYVRSADEMDASTWMQPI